MRRAALLSLAAYAACAPAASEPAEKPKIAPELADARALSRFVARAGGRYLQQSSVDRGGVDPGIKLLRNGNKDLNNWICASADAELGKALVPAVFDQPACAETYVRGAVAARFTGSGEMVRFWMTALSMRGSPADEEVLRVYVDDDPHPVVEATVASVADGSAGEMFAPPFGAGTSRFVSWRYPVVFGRKLIVALDHLGTLDNVYHQTDVILDTQPRMRAPARLVERDRAKAALLATPSGEVLLEARRTVSAGTTLEIAGPATITSLEVEHPERLGEVAVTIEWDGVKAIELPLAELFAAALDAPVGTTLGLAATGSGAALRLPMPFAKSARLSFSGAGEVALRAIGSRTASSERLYVERHSTMAPATGALPLLSIDGPGRWAGTCAMMEGHAIGGNDPFAEGWNFLEGDDRVTIDDELAVPGTGTEDYFDSAFYFLGAPRSTPFAAWWGVREDRTVMPWRGRATACRFHVANDTIELQKNLRATLEIGNGDPSLLDRYRTVAFYYR